MSSVDLEDLEAFSLRQDQQTLSLSFSTHNTEPSQTQGKVSADGYWGEYKVTLAVPWPQLRPGSDFCNISGTVLADLGTGNGVFID